MSHLHHVYSSLIRRQTVRAFSRSLGTHRGDSIDYSTRLFSSQPSNQKIESKDHHLLPRLYVGPTPTLETIRIRAGESKAFSPSESETSNIPRLSTNSQITLSTDQSHYLTAVLRTFRKSKRKRNVQSLVRLFDGLSGEWLAQIRLMGTTTEDVGSRNRRSAATAEPVVAECLEQLRPQSKQREISVRPAAWLCIAPPKKKERIRWLLEKATELGVDRIVWLKSDYSEPPQISSLEKLHSYLVEAAEQSERLSIPRFVQIIPPSEQETDAPSLPLFEGTDVDNFATQLPDLLDYAASDQSFKLLVCRERSKSHPLWQAFQDHFESSSALAFVVGPEGGWSPAELQRMDPGSTDFSSSSICNISLGPTVLRSETAVSAALAGYALFKDYVMEQSTE